MKWQQLQSGEERVFVQCMQDSHFEIVEIPIRTIFEDDGDDLLDSHVRCMTICYYIQFPRLCSCLVFLVIE